jgi:serine/threonine-protein kinase
MIAGRYRVVEALGHGAMGEVVRAEDLSLRQTVALKFLSASLAGDAHALDRVREEVRMARRVSHRNVCRVHDLGEADSQLFISMEYVDGEDLATLLRRVGRLAGDRALEIAQELCAGLSAAHAAGVIHRDLKPANVMLDRQGRVRITDFGLARLGEEAASAGEIAGTPAYMAPEQLAGAGATVRSDLYALGLVLYELFTGRRAFPAAPTIPELRRLPRETSVVPPAQLVREMDPLVERTILHCLATRPEERPESALAVLTALTGGDPLKAALAAGQTPSPSAVAAAPALGVLTPPRAWACVSVVLAGMALYFGLGAPLSALERVRPPLPPAALAAKAEEAMRALGHEGACVDHASGFAYDDEARRASASGKSGPAGRAEAAAAERRTIVFWYRCSPVELRPSGQTEVTRTNPPIGPAESLAVVDVDGRLLRHLNVLADGEASRNSPDALTTFLRLAGLESVSRAGTPLEDGHLSIDVRLDGSVPAKVAADFRAGRLVEASVVPPWKPPSGPRAVRRLERDDVRNLLLLVLILVSLPLAYKNLRAGRGDPPGASRVGLLVFGGLLAGLLLRAHHSGTLSGEYNVLEVAAAWSLYHGVTAALLYLALEPFVRRVWPERLVSWTRLLTGDVRDPMVARDVLLGIATVYGLIGLTIPMLRLFAARMALLPAQAALDPLLGVGFCFAATALAIALAVQRGLFILLLLLLLRAFGRIRWLAPVAFLAIVVGSLSTSLSSTGVPAAVVFSFALVFGGALLLLVIRVGLLAMTVVFAFGILFFLFPNATRLTGWTAFCAWWVVGISILGAAYGLYFSTGGRPFGDRGLLEG